MPPRDPAQERRLKEAHDRAKNEYALLTQQSSAAPQLSILIESHFLTVADSALASLGLPAEAVTGGRTNPVMDAARLADLLKVARTHKDVRILGNPRILTLSHRAAEVTQSPSDTDTNPPPSITFTVLPEFLPDGRHLRLTMTARVTETFDLAALPTAERPPGTDVPQGITVAPKAVGYRVRNLTNSTVVLPGQVVVMGYRAGAGTVPATPREGFVLVKATLVEPAETAQPPGNPPRH